MSGAPRLERGLRRRRSPLPLAPATLIVGAATALLSPAAAAKGQASAPAPGAASSELAEPSSLSSPVALPVVRAVSTSAASAGRPSERERPPAGSSDPEREEGTPSWLDGFSIGAFVDAYAQSVWTQPHPLSGDKVMVMPERAYTNIAGFSVSFLGLNLRYQTDSFGATLDLRFGNSVPRLLGNFSGLPPGLRFMKQAYVSWRPFRGAQIDFGEFDTIYGAEVSESWKNPNYSRGSLYTLLQPYYHTGFRLSYQPVVGLEIRGLVVNGWNNVVDNNDMKTFGLQVAYANGPLTLNVGYLGGPEQKGDNAHWRHLVDAVATLRLGDLSMVANFDYLGEDMGNGVFSQSWGISLAARLQVTSVLAVAFRGEYLDHPLPTMPSLATSTLTLEVVPVENLIIRLDNRVDLSGSRQFQTPSGAPSDVVFSSILGVVVRTN